MSHGVYRLLWSLPFFVDASSQRPVVQVGGAGEFSDGHNVPIELNSRGTTTVIALGATTGPAAVVRSVWTVCVDAVKRVAAAARPHVSRESGEVVTPFVAHGDTAAAVVGEVWIVRVVATLFGLGPRTIFAGKSSAFSGAVAMVALRNALALSTAARRGVPRSQVGCLHQADGPAVALTPPRRFQVANVGTFKNNQASVAMRRQIDKARHTCSIALYGSGWVSLRRL
jgi:hypothetical protein